MSTIARSLKVASLCALLLGSGSAQAFAVNVNDEPMLELIGQLEGPDGYHDIVNTSPIQPPKRLDQMTIREVVEFQGAMRRAGAASTAVGKYQFIRKTLIGAVEESGLSYDALFDKSAQDHLARILMKRCGFYDARKTIAPVGNCLARSWAALPVLTGDKAGQSYYGTRIKTNRTVVISLLEARF